MRGSDKFIKEQVELIESSFIILDSRVEPLEFLYISLPLAPHHIGIG